MLIIINNNTPKIINDSPIYYVLVIDVEYTGKHLLDDLQN